jgi:hypothetical protein
MSEKRSEGRQWVVHPDHVAVPKTFGMYSTVAFGTKSRGFIQYLEENFFGRTSVYTAEPVYNDIGVCDTSVIPSYILC